MAGGTRGKEGKKQRKYGRNKAQGERYRAREAHGNTTKARRIYKKLIVNAASCPGWMISQMHKGRAVRSK